jgi:hypothetical protein
LEYELHNRTNSPITGAVPCKVHLCFACVEA